MEPLRNIFELFGMFLAFLISSLPLYFSVKMLKGKTTVLKTMVVSFVAGILSIILKQFFGFIGGFMGFILMIWLYHEVFRLKWFKSFLAWLLQFVFIALMYIIFLIIIALFIGVSIITLI